MTQSREAKNQEKTEVLQNTLNFLVEVDTPFSLRVDIMRVIYIYIYIHMYTYIHAYIHIVISDTDIYVHFIMYEVDKVQHRSCDGDRGEETDD